MDYDSIPNFSDFPAYLFPQPPYLLLVFGLVASLLSGLAFQAVLKETMADWRSTRSTRALAKLRGWSLLAPFLGIGGGSVFFLAAGVEIFGLPKIVAYGVSIPLTIAISRLIWWQLGKLISQLEAGGSASLDLDSFT
jgi:hypothetical protein